jgi:hypothetical protein
LLLRELRLPHILASPLLIGHELLRGDAAMNDWRRVFQTADSTPGTPSSGEPWYRRPDAWFAAGVVVLPFGWVLGLCRVAWVVAVARRRRRL